MTCKMLAFPRKPHHHPEVEPTYVTFQCGFLFAQTPWRNYTIDPAGPRLLGLRARKARRKIREQRAARRRCRTNIPNYADLERAVLQLRRYAQKLQREAQ